MKKAKTLVLMVTLMAVVFGTYFIAGTYAKYTSTSNGTATVSVAKWAFSQDNAATEVKVNLEDTIDASTLVAGKIAPGTKGGFGVNVNSKDTEVAVDFTVSITAVGNLPSNLVLYGTRTCTEGNPCEYSNPYTIDSETGAIAAPITKTGVLVPNDAVGLDVELYWVWEYETGAVGEVAANDIEDTTDGVAAGDISFTLSITGVQREPSSVAIPASTLN